jgi:hypothetical protein
MQFVHRMGTARTGREKRDLSKHETLYQDPDYDVIQPFGGTRRQERVTAGVLAGGSSLETLGGLVALVAAIVGFASAPFQMAGIATIALGIAVFAQGIAIVSRWKEAVRRIQGTRVKERELAGGITTEVFAGIVGVVLGIVGLAGIQPLIVYPVAVVVFGGALLLGGAAQPDLVYLSPDKNPKFARLTYDAIQTSGGIMVLVGVAAAVLGILGLLQVGPILTLTLVGLLAIASALVFAGGVLTARLLHRFT